MFAPEEGTAQAEQILQELSTDLMSPFCPGRTIASCPSKAARALEDDILTQAKTGKTRDEIEASLVERYGSDIVGYEPPPLVLWGTIFLGLFALMGVAMLGRRWVRRTAPAGLDAAGSGGVRDPDVPTRGSGAGDEPTRAELDALDDALDDEDAF